jgi:hypothetical protein
LHQNQLFTANIKISTEAKPDQYLKVFCFGVMQTPKMIAPKEIRNFQLGYSCIKAMARRGQGP